ncbi:uncharacterized protein LOC144861465 [Branchiostoma floridae x Branchiostoma japonicum]
MAGLVLVFTMCWAPLLIYNLLVKFEVISRYTQAAYILKLALHLLAYSNSCVNPVCYAFLSRHFRSSFMQSCRCLPPPLRGRSRSGNWMTNRTTVLRDTTFVSGTCRSKAPIQVDRTTELPGDVNRDTGYTTDSTCTTCQHRWNNRHSSIQGSTTSRSESLGSAKLRVTLRRSNTSTTHTCSLTIQTVTTYTCPAESTIGTGKENCRQQKPLRFGRRVNFPNKLSESAVFGIQDQNYELATIGELNNQTLKPAVYFETSV